MDWNRFFLATGICAIVLFFSVVAFGKSYDVPKDAVIKVYNADGKLIGNMKRSEYKVVRLGTSTPPKVVTKVVKKCSSIKEVKSHTTIGLKAGVGNDGLYIRHDKGNHYEVREAKRAVGGIELCHGKKGVAGCLQILSNETATVGIQIPIE